MNRVEEKFSSLREKREKAFVVFLTAGFPDPSLTPPLVLELEKRGVDLVELGVPFSDPLADGPIIQESSQKALQKGVTLKEVLRVVKEIREKSEIPLILMGYYNPILRMGVKKFIREAKKAGVDGFIVADLPPEDASFLLKEAKKKDLVLIFLLTPVTPPSRVKLICSLSRGFIYCVSYTGVTGAEKKPEEALKDLITWVRNLTPLPVLIGFGVSTPSQAKEIASFADGVIVGSKVIKKIQEKEKKSTLVEEIGDFIFPFVREVKGGI